MKERYGAGAEADSGAGSGGSGRIPSFLFFSFPFCSGLGGSIVYSFHLSAGMKGSGGGAPPSSRLARRRRGYWVLSYSNYSAYSMNKTKQKLGARSGLRLQTKFTNIARLSKFSQISESTVNIVLLLDCEIISGWEKLNPERPKIHGLSD